MSDAPSDILWSELHLLTGGAPEQRAIVLSILSLTDQVWMLREELIPLLKRLVEERHRNA